MGLVLVLALAGVACSGKKGGVADPIGAITDVRGTVDLIHDGTATQAIQDAELFAGDAIRVNGSGSASFRLGGDGKYELLQGRARVQRADVIRTGDGVLLVSSDKPVEADFGAVGVAFSKGTVRVELGTPGRIAAYEVEDLNVAAGSQQVPLPRLWQVSITPDGRLDQARPLQFSRDDPVDAIHLAHALDADGKLGNLLRGVEPQLAATNGSALRNRLASGGIGPDALAPFASVARSDTLMGLAFAREWRSAELVKSFEQAMALKVLGASWGLIAQSFNVSADALVSSLQNEINAVLFSGGSGEGGQLVPTRPQASRPAPSGTQRSRAAPAGTQPPPAPASAPAAPPGRASPGPEPGLVGPVVDPLKPLLPNELAAIIDELYGLTHGLVPLL